MFKLKLSIALSCHIDVIEEMPHSLITEYEMLNIISPFFQDRQAQQLGFIASLLYNHGKTPNASKTPAELFRYLGDNTDFLQPELFLKAKNIINSLNPNSVQYEAQLNDIKGHIQDTIDIENERPNRDDYLIKQLKGLL